MPLGSQKTYSNTGWIGASPLYRLRMKSVLYLIQRCTHPHDTGDDTSGTAAMARSMVVGQAERGRHLARE
jgi:hypothetical protein